MSNSHQNFTTPTGKNFRDSSTLDEVSLTNHLEKLGYSIIDLSQQWRYYIGKLSKEDQPFFIKIATTEATNELLQNEVSFYEGAQSQVDKDIFKLQKVIKTGTHKDHNYFVADWFDGYPLAQFQYKNVDLTENDIEKLALIRIQLDKLNLSRDTLYKDKLSSQESKEIKNKAEKYIKIAKDFAAEVPQDLDPLVAIVGQWREDLELTLNHGSFEPRSVVKDSENNYLLIDAEYASKFSPKYYDLAHCYVKLYCIAGKPDLAELFLDRYFDLAKLNRGKEEKFLKPVIASRLIGSYWDGVQEGVEDFTYRDMLLKKL